MRVLVTDAGRGYGSAVPAPSPFLAALAVGWAALGVWTLVTGRVLLGVAQIAVGLLFLFRGLRRDRRPRA